MLSLTLGPTLFAEAVARRCSVKKVFLEISQNSQEGCNFIKKKTLTQVFSCEFCKISKNTFSYRTPPVAILAGGALQSNCQRLLLAEDKTY